MRPSVSDSSSVSCAVLLWDTEPGSELPIAFKGEGGPQEEGQESQGPLGSLWILEDGMRGSSHGVSWYFTITVTAIRACCDG